MSIKRKLAIPDAQDLVTLCCFNETVAPQIFSTISVKDIPNDKLREVFLRSKDYYDEYHKVMGSHLSNEFADELSAGNVLTRNRWQDLLQDLSDNSSQINVDYIEERLFDFKRVQELRGNLPDLVTKLEDGQLTEVEDLLDRLTTRKEHSKYSILKSSDYTKVTENIYAPQEEDKLSFGIKQLDQLNIYMRRKQLSVLLAPPKRGKSWWQTNALACAINSNEYKALVFTLEMSEVEYGERLVSRITGNSANRERPGTFNSTIIETDPEGNITNLNTALALETPWIRDNFTEEELNFLLKVKFKNDINDEKPFIIVSYPNGQLTTRIADAILDWLDKVENFQPDIIIVDYPAIMKIDIANVRASISNCYQYWSGVAKRKNAALVCVHQANRDGSKSQGIRDLLDETNIGEAFSIAQHCDQFITYNQSPQERSLGVARLWVCLNRHGPDHILVGISQNYSTGQFCLTSGYVSDSYYELIEDDAEESEEPRNSRTQRKRRDSGSDIVESEFTGRIIQDSLGNYVDTSTGEIVNEETARNSGFLNTKIRKV